ncbi:MAG: OB-fold nucleic acid binding domain-containing protein [Nanoarchaeota archaeon]|nr:OB-fold nucleic acid binding domain-containing protein [Nanoarchaeota archaeon]MBU1027629.1 OB-fold nucleic acid binding domain-containing protein [Nanoarchaeota archaeon]
MTPDEQQYKRHIAYKLRIGDILIGKPILDGERFSFVELGNKKIIRVNIIGNIVDKFESEGDKKYSFFMLDDGSGQIRLKVFGDDVDKFKYITQGLTVVVIGVLRYWNNELYINPEIVKEQDTKYLLIRKLEIEKEKEKNSDPLGKDQIIAVKDKLLGTIKNAEEAGGIEIEKIIMNLREISPTIINQEIQKLLEEGIIFEPRPGKVRYLG